MAILPRTVGVTLTDWLEPQVESVKYTQFIASLHLLNNHTEPTQGKRQPRQRVLLWSDPLLPAAKKLTLLVVYVMVSSLELMT